jgi:hypothetical protein
MFFDKRYEVCINVELKKVNSGPQKWPEDAKTGFAW